MGKTQKSASIILLLGLFLILSLNAAAQQEKVNSFTGNVSVGGSTSAASGAVVEAFIGSSSSAATSYTVGSSAGVGTGRYILDISCDTGNIAFLKVWGINATWQICNNYLANETNLSVSLVASGAACSYANACSGGYCCSGATVINVSGGSGTCQASACAAATAATTEGGGGGGGGGGGTALASETSTPVTILGATTSEVSFKKSSDIAVESIQLETTASAAIGSGQITVKETTVDKATASTIETSTSKVYKYLSITKVKIKDSDIQKAKVTFEVPVSWLTSNNIGPSTVKLNRLVNNQWVALATTLVSSGADKYVYEAETPGFSTFAISGEQKLTAFQIIDTIRAFYSGSSKYSAFDIIDFIRGFYA